MNWNPQCRRESLAVKETRTVWRALLRKCTVPTAHGYRHYGGKGVALSDRWQRFDLFLADMGPRPSTFHSVYRIGSAGAFAPGNCVWETRAAHAAPRQTRLESLAATYPDLYLPAVSDREWNTLCRKILGNS